VAASIQELGLIQKVDALLPVAADKGAKVTFGQRVAAMILNGLGFTDERLYIFEKFLEGGCP
jgi:transposase